MKIKRFKLKENVTEDDLIQLRFQQGGSFVNENAKWLKFKTLDNFVSVNLTFPEYLQDWNDFVYVLLLDEDFGQPYSPFYNYFLVDAKEGPPALNNIVYQYNKFMEELGLFEEANIEYK